MMLLATVADHHIVAATAATISFTQTDPDGLLPADPGTVTVGVTRSDGAEVVAPLTATVGTGAAPRTFVLTTAQTASIDHLTATWTSAGVIVGVTTHAIIGAPLLSVSDMSIYAPSVVIASDADRKFFVQRRKQCDDRFHQITWRGLTPRFAVEISRAEGGIVQLTYPDLRSVRWATDSNGTSIDVSTVSGDEYGRARLSDGCWPVGDITVGYEYGYDRAPQDIVEAAATFVRVAHGSSAGTVDPRAESFTNERGAMSVFGGKNMTGIPSVDAVLVSHQYGGQVA